MIETKILKESTMQEYLLVAELVGEGFLCKVIVKQKSEGQTEASHEEGRKVYSVSRT